MPASGEDFTIGVEEEFLLVDPVSRRLVPRAAEVLAQTKQLADQGGAVQHELQLSQIETGTGVCHDLGQVRNELNALRRGVGTAARDVGCRIASSGTYPLPLGEGSRVTPKPAYERLEREYELVSREQVLCGCHVHVGMIDPEVTIAVMNRARPWLPVLLALSANSPFWQGNDTGYASFRTETWRRWPLAGPPEEFESRAEYDELVRTLLAVQAIDEPARLYWDIRPSARLPTLEFRVADAGLTVDDSVTIAGLIRALVSTCHAQVLRGQPAPSLRMELLRAATWRAARYGLGGTLVDLVGSRSRPATAVVEQFLEYVGPVLSSWGDADEVCDGVKRIVENGNGASRQRAVFEATGKLEDVVDFTVAETDPS